MKISSKTQYALKTVLDLAVHRKNGLCKVGDIAVRQGIPQKFLEQILLILKGAGIVGSKRGVNGGYYLARSPTKVTLATIVRVTGDSLASIPVLDTSANAEYGTEAALHEVWGDISNYVSERLEEITVQKMCTRMQELLGKEIPEYTI